MSPASKCNQERTTTAWLSLLLSEPDRSNSVAVLLRLLSLASNASLPQFFKPQRSLDSFVRIAVVLLGSRCLRASRVTTAFINNSISLLCHFNHEPSPERELSDLLERLHCTDRAAAHLLRPQLLL
jgi:hypothetical protein